MLRPESNVRYWYRKLFFAMLISPDVWRYRYRRCSVSGNAWLQDLVHAFPDIKIRLDLGCYAYGKEGYVSLCKTQLPNWKTNDLCAQTEQATRMCVIDIARMIDDAA